MQSSRSFSLFAGLLAIAAMLCGCGGAEIRSGITPAFDLRERMHALRPPWENGAGRARRDHGRSWMAPDAKEHRLLYVSDDSPNDVYVFSYPKGKLEGTLTGFNSPSGLCADKKGDVFVTSAYDSDILEFAHGGSTPIRKLPDNRFPHACAVESQSDNLAAMNDGDFVRGGFAIYTHAQGKPRYYRAMGHPYECGYDAQGNLFVDGTNLGRTKFQLGELANKSKKFQRIAVDQSFSEPGGVKWDGSNLAVGDVYGSVIYQFKINGRQATEVGSTPVNGVYEMWEFWIDKSEVIIPNVERSGSSSVLVFDYPAGGDPVASIGRGTLTEPVGVAISSR
jgi:hypothetical protein